MNSVSFVIYCDAVPGKGTELDSFLTSQFANFWTTQKGVTGYDVHKDKMIGYPDRVITVRANSFTDLQHALDNPDWRNHQTRLNTLIERSASQILEPVTTTTT